MNEKAASPIPLLRPASQKRSVSEALVAVCRDLPVTVPVEARDEFVAAVRQHRIAPLAQVRVRDSDPATAASLLPDRETAKERYLKASMLLAALPGVLDDIPWVVFKGPVLSEHAHPVPGLRWFNDVDILVSPSRLRQASGRLLAAGWKVLDRDASLRATATPGEMHWLSPLGLVVDLHWSMINMAKTRHAFPMITDSLLADRMPTTVGLSSTWTLSPVDTLIHTCLHAAKTGANKMQMLLDADQLARSTDDWDAVVDRAHQWGAAQAVAIVLGRARTHLTTPVPADLERRLGVTRAFRLTARATDRLSPVPSLRRSPSLARLVARSARPGNSRTLLAIGRRTVDGVLYRLRPKEDPSPWNWDALAKDDALERYFTAVEREATGDELDRGAT